MEAPSSLIQNAGLVRRLMAMVYDSFLVVASLMVVSIPFVMIFGEQALTHNPFLHTLYQLALLMTVFFFFGWFWTHGGQTLGMRAWRLRTLKLDDSPMNWSASALRFAAAVPSLGMAGLGLLWLVFDPDRLAWHDRLTRTHVVVEPKRIADQED